MLDLLVAGLLMLPMPVDTVVILGLVERDLTGDGRPEVLRLEGVGETTDSLTVTFTIESGNRVLYRAYHAPFHEDGRIRRRPATTQ